MDTPKGLHPLPVTGLDLHFCFKETKIKVSFPSSRERATPHWGVAFRMFKSHIEAKHTHTPYGVWVCLLLVYTLDIPYAIKEMEGFE